MYVFLCKMILEIKNKIEQLEHQISHFAQCIVQPYL